MVAAAVLGADDIVVSVHVRDQAALSSALRACTARGSAAVLQKVVTVFHGQSSSLSNGSSASDCAKSDKIWHTLKQTQLTEINEIRFVITLISICFR